MSAVSLNPLHAGDPRRSAWVSANAGTGKTYTLANRVTRLLLDGAPPERILCLTYTKAAASEMAGRLFAQLGEWAMLDDDALAKRILEIGAPTHDAEGLRRARRLFALALETPGGLKIQTIHSFCQNLLARFPLEAGVVPFFRVLDDQTAHEMAAEARSRVLERAGAGDELLQDAITTIVTGADETKLEAVLDSALGSDRRKFERFAERHGRDMESISAAVRSAHGIGIEDSCESITNAFCAEMRADEEHLRKLVDWLRGGSKTDVERADMLARALKTGLFEDFARVFLTQAGDIRDRLATKGAIAGNEALHARLEQLASQCLAAERRCRSARAAVLAEASMTLALAVHTDYAATKRARGVLDYDDLVMDTLRLLESRDAAAWVLYKLDGGLDHILIDEGQDTSPEQWRIVQRLAEEFFAGSGARDGVSRTIFVVGDEKQSIFSFQGANPIQFDIQRAYFEQRATEGGNDFVNIQLSTSRRSAPEILSFVDEVFSSDEARRGVTSGEAPISHEAFRAGAKGRVEFRPTVKPSDLPEADLWQRPVDIPSPGSPVVRLASDVADRIRSWTNGRTCLPGRDKPIHPGDIMVLMPRREPFASEIIRQLKQRGVPVAGADRIRLKQNIAVMDLVALGRFALLSEDDLTLATVLRSPLVGFSEEALLSLCARRKGSLWAALGRRRDELASFGTAHEFLSECLRRADFSPPFEFYAHVLGAQEMRSRLLARLGVEANDAIEEFLSLAIGYEALNTPSLEGFLHWLERGDAEIKRDMERGRDEVRVMTVHGAKGLEADIVVLPDISTAPLAPGRRGVLLYTDEGVFFPLPSPRAPEVVERAKKLAAEELLKEHRRLLYVALTRPRDYLYVSGFEGKRGVDPNSWHPLLERAIRKLGSCEGENDDGSLAIGAANAELAAPIEDVVRPLALPDWVRRAPIEEAEKPRLIRPSLQSDSEGPEVVSPTASTRRFERGLLVHALLAHLPRLPPERRREAAQKFLATRKVESADLSSLVDETLRVLEHPDFAPVFALNSRAEVAVVADLPELGSNARISGRLDRLSVQTDSVLVVDFKTNRAAPLDAHDVPPLYLTQMALYRAALAKIFLGRRIDCAFVWTETPALMPLTSAILDAEIERIRGRLDPVGDRS